MAHSWYSANVNLQRPFQVIAPTLDGDVLTLLARGDRALTGRAIEKEIGSGGSHGGVRRALDHLVAEGIVTREPAGQAYLYRLNREHLAAPWIERLANLRLELIDRLRTQLESWQPPPPAASLFGSAARGEAGRESDIDLLIVRPAPIDYDDLIWRGQVTMLEEAAARWTGNDVRVLEIGANELAIDEPAFDTVAEEGVELVGSLRRLRAHARRRRA